MEPTNSEKVIKKRNEILYDGYYYDVTEWAKIHPGGTIIKYYLEKGEDATIPIQQFHKRSEKKVMVILSSLKRRKATDLAVSSPMDEDTLARHQILTQDFVKLYREFEAEGHFDPSPSHIILRFAEVLFFALFGSYLSFCTTALWLQIVGALSICVFISRSGWLMHEAGHHSLTGVSKIDRLLSDILYGVGFGLSSTWWRRNHNMHHSMPNRFHRDHDLDTMPLFAFSKVCVKDPKKEGKGFLIQHQANLFLLVSNLLGVLAWKVYIHPLYTIRKRDWKVLFFMTIHYIWMLSLNGGILGYLFSTWLVTNYYFGNFALSHTHLPVVQDESSTSDPGHDQEKVAKKSNVPLHWVEYAFHTTMNITPSIFINWWMGYLNFQIEHHLFPACPQKNHQKIYRRVREFAREHKLPYYCASYSEACKLTYYNMKKVSDELLLAN